MDILGLILNAFNNVGSGISIISGIYQAINKYHKITAEDLFKKSFVREVKQNATTFADQTDLKTVDVDENLFDDVIASLKDEDEVQFAKLDENEKIAKITTLFRKCIIIPKHQLTTMDLDRRIRPIIERTIIDFYAQLPFNEGAFNQIVLEYIQINGKNQDDAQTMLTELSSKIDYVRTEVSQRLSEDIKAIKDDTEKIKDDTTEIKQTAEETLDLLSKFKSQHDLKILELDINWFKTQFEKQKASIGDKFDASLHTETQVDTYIHALLGDRSFIDQITEWIEKLEKYNLELKEAINDFLNSSVLYEIEWNEDEKLKVIEAAVLLQDSLLKIIFEFKQAREFLIEKRLAEFQAINWELIIKHLKESLCTYRKVENESGMSKISYTGNGSEEYEQQVLRHARNLVHYPDSLISNVLDEFHYSAEYQLELINQPNLHILGGAGIGKTHIACNICDDRLKNGFPALFVRGSQFTTEQPIETQLRTILDIPPSYSWHDFLQALSAAAQTYRTRIPLIIDGLNESTHNDTFSKVWELGLKGLVEEIKQIRNVVLITTCRISYKEAIWKDEDPPNGVDVKGFNNDEVTKEAIRKYFNAYKINADITLAPLAQFEHPLYLKIFCETKNRERMSEVQVYIGEQTLFEVFDEYLEQCNNSVCERRKLRHGTSILQPMIGKIAEYLWKHNRRYIPLKELINLTDNQSLETLNWLSSIAGAIEAEGLLVCRDYFLETDVMSFTYDLLGGYLIAEYLLEQADDDIQGFINSEEVVEALFSENYQTLHPLHEDISRCLAALIPSKTGEYLHHLTKNKIARCYSIHSLFEISPKYITDDCVNKISHIFKERPDSRKPLLKLAESTIGHPGHPFNSRFWSDQLSTLSMQERDLSWTEHVRKKYELFEKMVLRFEETCKDEPELSEIGKERLHLMAEYIMWILTSTVRPLRDIATRALYWYGRRFPNEFFKLVLKSFTINDPYVSERMLAATYGIAMAHHNSFKDCNFLEEELHVYGRDLYENMFKPNAQHATTHILARDYAKRTIDIALIHQPDLLTDEEKKHIEPPYTDGGIREWGECENKNEGESKKRPDPIQMDFDIYTLKSLIKYDNENPDEYRQIKANVYWRIYDLGFSLDCFGKIDRILVEENYRKYGRSGDGRKTDRYGKKYSWIAYFELAGFRQDNNLLPDRYEDARILDADIDPSFPEEQEEYNHIHDDYLGNRDETVERWISNTSHPDLTTYLEINQHFNEHGPWVLLHGYISQEDKQFNRYMFAWLQGLIVKSNEVEHIIEILKKQEDIDAHIVPSDYRTYAGEIPWCNTYPPNNWQKLSLKTGVDIVEKPKFILERNGKPLTDKEKCEFWESIKDLTVDENSDMIQEKLSELNIDCNIEIDKIEKPVYEEIEALVPVRENIWEESCSGANPYRSIALPSREIAENLGLYMQSNSFDLFERENGKQASISFRNGKIYGDIQHFTYLRKDLLERFLIEEDGALIWVIWGNRRYTSQNPNDPYENFQDVKTYSDLQNPSGDP